MNENELFREIIRSGLITLSPQKVNITMLEREMAFIESRHLESYFNVAHTIIASLKWDNDIIVGPGRGQVLCVLGNGHYLCKSGFTWLRTSSYVV